MSRALNFKESGLSKREWSLLKKLSTPKKVQDFINSLSFNHEKDGETYMSVSRTLGEKTAHCFEGALVAAAALWAHGEEPLILDLQATSRDVDHVVALFKKGKYWGSISKTNHGVLRYREPIYRTVRELVLSFFNEYILNDGTKTLRGYSKPFNLRHEGTYWLSDENDLYDLMHKIDNSPHYKILTQSQLRNLRKADLIERKMSGLAES